MSNGGENREIKCSNICVGRGESLTYAVNQRLCRQGRRNVGVEKVECRWGGDSRVMQLPSKAAVRRLRWIYVILNVAGFAVSEPTAVLNFRWPFYCRVWVESAPKNFGGEVYWLGEKKYLLICKYKVIFQLDGCLEPTCATTCFIHFCLGHRLDNIRVLKCTFVVFYLFIY